MSRRPWKHGAPVAPSPSATKAAPQIDVAQPIREEPPAPQSTAPPLPNGLISCRVHNHGALHHNGTVYAPGAICAFHEHVIASAAGALIRTE